MYYIHLYTYIYMTCFPLQTFNIMTHDSWLSDKKALGDIDAKLVKNLGGITPFRDPTRRSPNWSRLLCLKKSENGTPHCVGMYIYISIVYISIYISIYLSIYSEKYIIVSSKLLFSDAHEAWLSKKLQTHHIRHGLQVAACFLSQGTPRHRASNVMLTLHEIRTQ